MVQREAAGIVPVNPDLELKYLKPLALEWLGRLGEVNEATLCIEVHERAAIAGLALPWKILGIPVPDDYLAVRFSAAVEVADGGS